nr:hypothetical protein Iba_chr05fCG15000 [Ipomoea batatas]
MNRQKTNTGTTESSTRSMKDDRQIFADDDDDRQSTVSLQDFASVYPNLFQDRENKSTRKRVNHHLFIIARLTILPS